MSRISVLSIIFLSSADYPQDGNNGSKCNFPTADSLLNQVFSQVIKEYKADTLFIKRLREAQRAWIKFRDAYLESRFPSASNATQYNEYGSIYPYCACEIMTDLTKERIKQLEAWLNGTIEGDVCGGSYEIKQ